MSKKEMFQVLCRTAEMIAKTFGTNCETVVHDCDDIDNFIAAIYNGHVSGRKVGDKVDITGLPRDSEFMENINYDTDLINKQAITQFGRVVKSSTIYFKGDDYCFGLGINFDITQFSAMDHTIKEFISTQNDLATELNTNMALDSTVTKCIKAVGKPVSRMTKADRMQVVFMLKERNVFQIQKSIPYVAAKLKVSRLSIYKYLKELEEKQGSNV